ncbi:MAG: DUF2807 domain-containing protein [Bacteroidales bacterium]|nr:DUF2807 domain-containing protein [Bacteroidales bacterium]
MKKTIVLLAAALLAALPLSAARVESDPADVRMETKTYQLGAFSELQVGWTYQVALTQAPRHSVRVEAPDFAIPYLDVRVSGNRLVLGVREMPRNIRQKVEMALKHNEIRAWVAMPELSSLQMSGAAKLDATGDFTPRRDDFRMELSGATVLRGLNAEARTADIRCSGAAKFSLQGNFVNADIHLSGAASGSMELRGKEASLQMSGAIKFELDSRLRLLDVNASGATSFRMDGSVSELKAVGSGASKLNLANTPAENVNIRLSGAASATIDVQHRLSVELSGASTCRYKAGPDFSIVNQDVSRGSSLSRL